MLNTSQCPAELPCEWPDHWGGPECIRRSSASSWHHHPPWDPCVAQHPRTPGHNAGATKSARSLEAPQTLQCHRHCICPPLVSEIAQPRLFSIINSKTTHLAVCMKLPEFDIIHKGHVVWGMPVQAVAMEVKRDRVNEAVDGLDDLKYIMSCVLFWKNCKLCWFTSSPFCWAGQFVMERDPDMKSFCTSTMRNAVRGLTIL